MRSEESIGLLKVILLTSRLSSAAGGLAISVPKVAHGVARTKGWGVHVVGVKDPEDPEAATTWGPNVHAHLPKGPRGFAYASGMERTVEWVAPAITDVQGLWTYPSLVNLRYHRRHNTPYIVTPRGMLDPWARARSRWKKQVVRFWFEDAHLREATCLRATSQMEASHFRDFGLRQPIAVVPNGIDTPEKLPNPCRGRRRRALFLSRIHPKKGLPFLLRAWAAVAPNCPDWELVIAGPDEIGHMEEMRALAGKLAVPRVRWCGPVSGQAKDDLYRSADLFILPTHAENFGLVVGEAMAQGVPVITTKNAPWDGLDAHRCGWWIELSHRSLVDALTDATRRDRGELEAMGARGYAWMKRDFSWDRVAGRMGEV